MARINKYTDDRVANIQSEKSKKNARKKMRKAQNARLRESGEKFSKKDACYNG